VAGEVRNLAKRSASAANEISDMIKDSIEKVETGTILVNKSGEYLVEIIESSKVNGTALEKVIRAIDKVSQLISEIAMAGDEQRKGIEQLNTAVIEMDTMTQQNAALVEETATASEEMANQSQELIMMMDKFKIREGVRNEVKTMKHKKLDLHTGGSVIHYQKKKDNGNGKAKSAAQDAQGTDIKYPLTKEGFKEF
jgi:methyl-accepting chemotaxis protein